jgi:hypothetical protein
LTVGEPLSGEPRAESLEPYPQRSPDQTIVRVLKLRKGDGVRHNRPQRLITPTRTFAGGLHRARLPRDIPGRHRRRQPSLLDEPLRGTRARPGLSVRHACHQRAGQFRARILSRVDDGADHRGSALAPADCGGILRGFTTFSSYAYETMTFFEQGQLALLTANFVSNNLLACAGILAGMALARVL